MACICGSALAQVFTFDEFGAAQFGPPSFAPDPGPGGLAGALTYPLPFPGTPGDLILREPPANSQNSDVIRWNGNGTLIFYSDNVPAPEAPADTGLPGANYPGPVIAAETGVEGGIQDYFYTPGPGMPGFDPSVAGATYHFISDVPEPGAISAGVFVACLFVRRRSRAA